MVERAVPRSSPPRWTARQGCAKLRGPSGIVARQGEPRARRQDGPLRDGAPARQGQPERCAFARSEQQGLDGHLARARPGVQGRCGNGRHHHRDVGVRTRLCAEPRQRVHRVPASANDHRQDPEPDESAVQRPDRRPKRAFFGVLGRAGPAGSDEQTRHHGDHARHRESSRPGRDRRRVGAQFLALGRNAGAKRPREVDCAVPGPAVHQPGHRSGRECVAGVDPQRRHAGHGERHHVDRHCAPTCRR